MNYRRLGDFVELSQGLAVNKGTAHFLSNTRTPEFPYPLLRIVDFGNDEHDNYSKYVSKDISKSMLIDDKSIVFTRVTGECFRGFSGVLHNNLFNVKLTSDEITEDYLFTVLQSDFIKKQAFKAMSSSVVPDLSHEKFKSMIIPVPDKNTQREISNVYLSLVEKIKNNNFIIAELDAMAKTLYDYWFLQFEFPNADGKPYKSSGGKMVYNEQLKKEIPVNWMLKRLGDNISYNRGVSYTGSDLGNIGTPIISLASIDRHGNYVPDGIKYYLKDYPKNKILKPYDLIMANTDMTQEREIMGKIIFVPGFFNDGVLSTHHITTINTDEKFKSYLMMTTQTQWFHNYIKGFSSGTNVLGLNMIGFDDYMILYPKDDVLLRFDDIIKNIYKTIFNNMIENKELTSLRDFLLPLLMNGQVTIGDKDEK